ncbi:mucin-2 isoform X3 [Musca domestica]|uniref:Mucin-2 isoform X3 n=1 Tax=Musca domestica TaxID=7370 RepID=A0A1I8MYI0_MUSDO|nr:mucin-2 isoform X3 [Musca domestica]
MYGRHMRFQRKQLLEREQKKLALTGSDSGIETTTTTTRNAIGNGKVRQMFEQRRGVGIDRSHPLKPITTTTTTTTITKTQQNPARRLTGGGNATTTATRRTVVTTTRQNTTSTLKSSHSNSSPFASNGNLFGDELDSMDNLDSETLPKGFSSLSLDNTRVMGPPVSDGNNNSRSSNGIRRDVMDTTVTLGRKPTTTNGIKLNPVITKKSPTTTAPRTMAAAQSRTPSSASRTSTVSRTSAASSNGTATKSPEKKTPTSVTSTTTKTGAKTTSKTGSKPATFVMAVKPPPRITTPPPGMATCQYCNRNFNEDRLSKHEEVCRKMVTTKRKIFDASKHRVKGTEAEKYVAKKKGVTAAPKAAVAKSTPADSSKKGNWRKKHEEFINAIREAKKVQAYLAKGGKLSDLPPPPPSENPDYVQCPHCSRRFNEAAAERHIPKCANMQHNKPKPPQKKRF